MVIGGFHCYSTGLNIDRQIQLLLDSLRTTTTTTERVCVVGCAVHVDITPGARVYCAETNYSFQLFAEQFQDIEFIQDRVHY